MLVDALLNEVHQARKEMRDIAWIRVTTTALEGSIAAVPITKERARQIKLYAYEGETTFETQDGEQVPLTQGPGVDTDPELVLRPPLEILIHPADWFRLLVELPRHYLELEGTGTGMIEKVMGIDVKE